MPLIFALFVLASILGTSHGAVIGIDLGSEFLKVAVIRTTGVDIVLNQQTQRKTRHYVGFRGEERYFGEDAYQLHTRFPAQMITCVNHFLGSNKEDVEEWQKQLLFPFALNTTARQSIAVDVQAVKDEGPQYTAEELMGMLLAHLKDQVSIHTGTPMKDVIISVPHAYNYRQRQAVFDAGTLAGLNVLSLMSPTTAAALQWGINHRGMSKTLNTIILDVGATKTEVGVFTFTPPAEEDKKKLAHDSALGDMQTRAIVSDSDNGGRQFDAIVARHIAAKHKQQTGVDVLAMNTLEGYRAVAKLMRSAQKAKEVLSANTVVQATVEGIWDDQDFVTSITRAELEKMIDPLVTRAIDAVQQAVAKGNLTMDEVDTLELMGGGSRVPILQERLKKLMGDRPLGRKLNTDEAIVTGATFHGARLSGAFRVRSFSLKEKASRNISFSLSATEENPEPAIRDIFIDSKLPSRKLVTVFRQKAFNLTMYEKKMDSNGEVVHEAIDMYRVLGVSKTFNRLGTNKEWVHPKSKASLELKLRLSEDGMPSFESAVAKYEEVVNTTTKVKVGTRKVNNTENDTESAEQNTTGESENDTANATETANTTNSTGKNKTKEVPVYETINSTRTNNKQEKLTFNSVYILTPLPMAPQDFIDSNTLLSKLQKRDDAKLEIAQARNSLESALFDTKYDKFFDDETLKEFYTAEDEAAIRAMLASIDEWLEEGEGQDATAEAYSNKLKDLEALTGPVYAKRNAAKAEQATKVVKEEAAEEKEDPTKPNADGEYEPGLVEVPEERGDATKADDEKATEASAEGEL